MWLFSRVVILVLLALLPAYLMISTIVAPASRHSSIVSTDTQPSSSYSLDNALNQWDEGDYQASLHTLKHINQPQAEVYFYRDYFERYLQFKTNQAPPLMHASLSSEDCRQQILFVTGDVYSLAQAEVFKAKFAADTRLTSLPICIKPVIWFDPDKVNCNLSPTQNGRLVCDLPQLAQSLKAQSFTHIVVFAEEGKANVHNGIMFLDRKDTYDVFVHELAHFSGFVDEYPLSGALAKQICSGLNAPNVLFSQNEAKNKNLTKARTCDNHSVQAYKTSKKMTFMEYHDVGFIPENYLAAWRNTLLNRTNSPSAHINFAQYYEIQNNPDESQYWRAKFRAYLNL